MARSWETAPPSENLSTGHSADGRTRELSSLDLRDTESDDDDDDDALEYDRAYVRSILG